MMSSTTLSLLLFGIIQLITNSKCMNIIDETLSLSPSPSLSSSPLSPSSIIDPSDNETLLNYGHHQPSLSSSSSSPGSSLSWNFTQWWNVRQADDNQQLYSEPIIIFQEPTKYLQQYGDFDRFGHIDYRPPSLSSSSSSSNNVNSQTIMIGTNVFHIDPTFSPRTSIDILNQTIRQYFSRSRHSSDDKIYLRDLRESLKDKFLSYGLKTAFHVFKTEYTQDKTVKLIFSSKIT